TRVRRLVMTSPLQGNVSGGQIVTSSAGGRVQRRCSLLFSSCLSFDFLAATTLAEPEVDAGAETTWTINVENRHPFRSTAGLEITGSIFGADAVRTSIPCSLGLPLHCSLADLAPFGTTSFNVVVVPPVGGNFGMSSEIRSTNGGVVRPGVSARARAIELRKE